MKKILVSLLTVAMLFTIGATNVFAAEDYGGDNQTLSSEVTNKSGGRFEGETYSGTFGVGLGVNPATKPSTHDDYFTPGGVPDENAKAVYCVGISWKVKGGMYTESAEWEWNPETLNYVKKQDSVRFEIDANPNVSLSVTNKSNKDVWYSVSATDDTTNGGFLAENALNEFQITAHVNDTKLVAPGVGSGVATTKDIFTNKVIELDNEKNDEIITALTQFMESADWNKGKRLDVASVTLKLQKTAPAVSD